MISVMDFVLRLRKYRLEFVNFVVGAAVLTFELAASRIAAPYIGTSIYIWTSIIGVILAALALGYWMGGKLADRRKLKEDIVILLVLAAALILFVNIIKDSLLSAITDNSLSLQWQALIASILIFSPPAVVLGMVSPYLARLNITKLSDSGQKLASISAWGTVGSLVGTFLTGYVLFGLVGTRHLLAGIALSLLFLSFAMSLNAYLAARLLFFVAILLQLFTSPTLGFAGVKADIDTRYSRVTVRDTFYGNRPVRVLQMDRKYWQSGIYLDGSKELVFPYTRGFYSLAQSKPDAKKHLIIGGGAFTLPEHIARTMPQSQIDVVEIDGGLVGIAKKHFGFSQPKNLNIIIADGRQYLNVNQKNYDVIILDAFSSVEPPFQLFTKEAAERIKASLSRGGMVGINVISAAEGEKSEMLSSIIRTYSDIFKSVNVYQASPGFSKSERQNLIVIAGDESLPSTGLFSLPHDNFAPGRILTDNFAPVERMTSQGI